MRIVVVTPAKRAAHNGNRVTALRWAGHLRALGHRVALATSWDGQPCDLLIALHATRSMPSVVRYRERRGDAAPVVVGLAGTDVYQDLPASAAARRALALATRLVVLQPLAIEALPQELRHEVRPILQSARGARAAPRRDGDVQICQLAHLRPVKDPLLGAAAVRLLPPRSRVRIVHLGAALDAESAAAARAETAANARYVWLGDRPRREALATLAASDLLLVTSRMEGGANAVSEALAAGVPVLSTRIDGSVGVLGPDYPGYFPVGDAAALADLLRRAEEDGEYLASLRSWTERLRHLVDPARERDAWRALLAELHA